MRMMKKGGVPPCDRRLDRRKVAIAAAAALFLFATEVRANFVDFVIVNLPGDESFLKNDQTIFGAGVGINASLPQYIGSDSTTYYGQIWVDLQPTTIQLMPGSNMYANVGVPGFPGFPTGIPTFPTEPGVGPPGLYLPLDPVISDPDFVNPGLNPNSNYGYFIPALGVVAVAYDIKIDMGNSFAPSTPMGFAGTSFNLAGQGLGYTAGRQAFVSGLGNDTGSLAGDPVGFFGTNGADIGTWDPLDLTAGPLGTLRLPFHSQFTFNITTSFGGIDETVFFTGQLLATPRVPEPSTMTLLGFGVVGLLSYAWRARKRKALVA